jgi:hypothetical protein
MSQSTADQNGGGTLVGIVVFAEGMSKVQIKVQIIDDADPETDETFVFHLTIDTPTGGASINAVPGIIVHRCNHIKRQ